MMKCNKGLSRQPSGHPGRRLRGLLALNGALLMALGAVVFGPSADAQLRPRGDYTMVAGRVNGAHSGVVYIVDTANQELIALTYDHNEKRVEGVGYRNLAADASNQLRAGGGR